MFLLLRFLQSLWTQFDVLRQPQIAGICLNPPISIHKMTIYSFYRKCVQFDVYIYPLKSNASILAQRLHKQLMLSRYSIDTPNKACVLVALLDRPEELNSLTQF